MWKDYDIICSQSVNSVIPILKWPSENTHALFEISMGWNSLKVAVEITFTPSPSKI